MAKTLKDGVYCAKDGGTMRRGFVPQYEYEEGYTLRNVPAYICPKCGKIFFTEEQASEMERRTKEKKEYSFGFERKEYSFFSFVRRSKEKKEYSFGFERKVTVSGKSLVVGIPSELAEHLKIKRGQKVRIIPVARDGFMIRKTA